MADYNYNVFWQETYKQIKNFFSADDRDHEFTLWFEKISYVSSTEDSITLSVPSAFFKDQLNQRGYAEIIQEKFTELLGTSLSINFIIEARPQTSEKKNTEKTETKETSFVKKVVVEEKRQHPNLRSDYSFETFVPGEDNSFAYNAAVAISKNPGRAYNPVLIYGGVGLGKTHLMQAIGNAAYEDEDKKVIYITAEDFTNEFMLSLRNNSMTQFKNKYRSADTLLIDDIHFFQNKEGTQEELFHTFKALYETYKQIVFTCDRPVSELKNLSDRLRSRFESGLNVDLQPPNYETRLAILEKKTQQRGIHIPKEVLDLIARNISTNVRDLEASLTKLIAYAELVNKDISLEVAQQQLRDVFGAPRQANITIETIQKVVCEYFAVSITDIKSKKRTRNFVQPRQVAMYIARELTEFSTTEIGVEFGGRDHSTVMHACDKISEKITLDSSMESMINSLVRNIKDYKK